MGAGLNMLTNQQKKKRRSDILWNPKDIRKETCSFITESCTNLHFMYEPDYRFIPKSFWEDLRKEVESSVTRPVNFNRPENIRQEFWEKIDDICYVIEKTHNITLSINVTPDGMLNANVYPYPEEDIEEEE